MEYGNTNMGAGGLRSSCVSTLLHGTGFFAGTGLGISLKLAEAGYLVGF